MTLEVVHRYDAERGGGRKDRLFGVAFAVPSCAAEVERLRGDFELSDVKPGIRDGTHVTTVRNAPLGVPTLFISYDRPKSST
jgi:hypothetical protein